MDYYFTAGRMSDAFHENTHSLSRKLATAHTTRFQARVQKFTSLGKRTKRFCRPQSCTTECGLIDCTPPRSDHTISFASSAEDYVSPTWWTNWPCARTWLLSWQTKRCDKLIVRRILKRTRWPIAQAKMDPPFLTCLRFLAFDLTPDSWYGYRFGCLPKSVDSGVVRSIYTLNERTPTHTYTHSDLICRLLVCVSRPQGKTPLP